MYILRTSSATLLAVLLFSNTGLASCPAYLAKLMQNLEHLKKFPVLTSRGKQVVRGSLLQFTDGSHAFAVGPMLLIPSQGHKAIEAYLKEQNPGKKIAQRWHGELAFQNGTLVAANETSGYMKSLELHKSNQVGLLREFLESQKVSFAVASNVDYQKWPAALANPSPHLDTTMSKLAVEDRQNSFLHAFNNTLNFPTMAIDLAKAGNNEWLWKIPEQWVTYKYIADLFHKEGYPFDGYEQVQKTLIDLAGQNKDAIDQSDIDRMEKFNDEFINYVKDGINENNQSWFYPLINQVEISE